MPNRPFRVLGLQQIAIGGLDKSALKHFWVDLLGLEVLEAYQSERDNVDEEICALGIGPWRVEVDLMEPLDPARKPAVHVPALNHVGLWIDDLAAAYAWLEAQGSDLRRAGFAAALAVMKFVSFTRVAQSRSRRAARAS